MQSTPFILKHRMNHSTRIEQGVNGTLYQFPHWEFKHLCGRTLCLTPAPSVSFSRVWAFVATSSEWCWKADIPDGLSFSGSDLWCHWWYRRARGPCANAQMGTETWRGHKTFSSWNPVTGKKWVWVISIKAYCFIGHSKRAWASIWFSDECRIRPRINLMRSSQE